MHYYWAGFDIDSEEYSETSRDSEQESSTSPCETWEQFEAKLPEKKKKALQQHQKQFSTEEKGWGKRPLLSRNNGNNFPLQASGKACKTAIKDH